MALIKRSDWHENVWTTLRDYNDQHVTIVTVVHCVPSSSKRCYLEHSSITVLIKDHTHKFRCSTLLWRHVSATCMDAELVDRGSTWACQAWLFTLEKKKNQPWQWLSILDVKHVPPPDRAPYLNVIIIWHRSSVFSPSWYQTTRVTNHEHQRDNVPLYLLSLVSRVTNLEASHCFAITQVDRSWEAMCYFVGVA